MDRDSATCLLLFESLDFPSCCHFVFPVGLSWGVWYCCFQNAYLEASLYVLEHEMWRFNNWVCLLLSSIHLEAVPFDVPSWTHRYPLFVGVKYMFIFFLFVYRIFCVCMCVCLIDCRSYLHMGFPGGTVVKNLPAKAGDTRDMGLIPGLGRNPWIRKGQPTPVFLPGKSHE